MPECDDCTHCEQQRTYEVGPHVEGLIVKLEEGEEAELEGEMHAVAADQELVAFHVRRQRVVRHQDVRRCARVRFCFIHIRLVRSKIHLHALEHHIIVHHTAVYHLIIRSIISKLRQLQ